MFLNDVNKREEIKHAAIEDLKCYGIKYRPKKSRHNVQETRIGRRVFRTALQLLPVQTVTLTTGQQLVVPKLVHELCSFILTKVETEGLFRKAGSKARQNEIRLSLDAGCRLDDSYHVIDVGNVLKTFFRELPEPLLPYPYHELFLRCMILQQNKVDALLLACLLLPSDHLSTLSYFMQFLHHVTEHSVLNKMDAYNLAVVIGPTLMPLDEKIAVNTTLRLTKTCEMFKMLIENAGRVGFISDSIIDRIAPLPGSKNHIDDEGATIKKKKKRRSGSLTRVFNGLRKIVGSNKANEVSPSQALATPDLLKTPDLTKSAKKRKIEGGGFSNKKRRAILQSLPQGTVLTTPVSVHPNPRKISPPKSVHKTSNFPIREKKSQWNLGSKRNKMTKQHSDIVPSNSNAFAGTKSALERRWSAVSQAAGFKKNKKTRHSYGSSQVLTPAKEQTPSLNSEDEVFHECETVNEENEVSDYMKVCRTEYEEIKNRVSAIEQRLSEINYLDADMNEEEIPEKLDVIEKVQNAYEETLVKAGPLSPTTDHLARRLSRDLKIRRSCEQKVFRSPSARKIGSVRRRSRDNDKLNKVQRNQSWHVESLNAPRINLKRGRPNTVFTGLPNLTPSRAFTTECTFVEQPTGINSTRSSLPGSFATPSTNNRTHSSYNSLNISDTLLSEKWTSAEGFCGYIKTPDSHSNCRASIAKLRSQNAGMVLAKARLFDGMVESDSSTNSQNSAPVEISKVNGSQHKIGSVRNLNKTTQKRSEEKTKKSMSPKKKNQKSPKPNATLRLSLTEKENQISAGNVDGSGSSGRIQVCVLKDCNRINTTDFQTKTISSGHVTPREMPRIKRNLTVKSPKRLNRTPLGLDHKQTPLKVINSKRVY